MILPDFICVGTGRAGTSWLYEVLLEHPEICMARNIKETQFFNVNYDKGVAWYEAFFNICSMNSIKGEISNRYIFNDEVALRIKKHIPDCKILICLRNPYDRIQSVYSFKIREGALNCSFGEALTRMPELIDENRYYTLLAPYYDCFGPERIFLVFFDDIEKRPAVLCRELFSFLGVASGFKPEVLGKKINQAITPRFASASALTKGAAKLMRAAGMYGPLTRAKRSDFIKGIFFRKFDYKKENLITSETRDLLDPVFLPELGKLEPLINRKLPHWRKES